jgi:hypothetical protein
MYYKLIAVIMADSNIITEHDIIYSPIEKTVESEKNDTLSNVEKKAIGISEY